MAVIDNFFNSEGIDCKSVKTFREKITKKERNEHPLKKRGNDLHLSVSLSSSKCGIMRLFKSRNPSKKLVTSYRDLSDLRTTGTPILGGPVGRGVLRRIREELFPNADKLAEDKGVVVGRMKRLIEKLRCKG